MPRFDSEWKPVETPQRRRYFFGGQTEVVVDNPKAYKSVGSMIVWRTETADIYVRESYVALSVEYMD